ncbi:hypothetical protein HDU86_004064 [Geranomyces michiganensis]|nr:hypothetical protein HDU86_004064 [Geranomyces michiganensis]
MSSLRSHTTLGGLLGVAGGSTVTASGVTRTVLLHKMEKKMVDAVVEELLKTEPEFQV